ncbi:MAG: NAD(P)-dependent glycerol-3-phosphate dehydrogenase [Verrucomicrobia bacterium]|nr:NAD(P)-dependent glycerol-3-phosphate dehydrogenase [Verrucomicrobiota bacterium]
MKIAVIGAGAWGTALANLLAQNNHRVTLWAHNAARADEIRETGRNERYLPGIDLSSALEAEANLQKAVSGADCAVIALPSKAFREVTAQLADFAGIAVSVTKGIEFESGLTMSGILRETMPRAIPAALSGPTLAAEVARGFPAAIVAAADQESTARQVQDAFHRPNFRVYTCNDLPGVELGGALKNVIAIAAGMCDGLGFGDNSKAALVTRAIAEIRRLGVVCGARTETFSGLSGLGDLMVTCFSRLSRNHTFGERIGRGEKVETLMESAITIAEGYPTARSAHRLAQKMNVETPIIEEVYATLYENKPIRQALQELMQRDLKAED